MERRRGSADLAAAVRRGREASGWSQAELGERVGRSQRWVSLLENAGIAVPRRDVLHKLAEVLGLDVAALYVAADLARGRREAAAAASGPAADPVRHRLERKLAELALTAEAVATVEANLDALLRMQRRARSAAPAAPGAPPAPRPAGRPPPPGGSRPGPPR